MSSHSEYKDEELKFNEIIKKDVLHLYNLSNASIEQVKIKNTDKQRAVYKITHNNINYCLKKVYYDEGNLLFMYSAMEWLYRNNINVPKLLPTATNNRFVRVNNIIFILTPWINGDKCDFDSTENILSSAKNLAQMHKCSTNFIPIKGSTIKEGFDNIYISITNHFYRILSCSNEARIRKDKFSKLFLSFFDVNYELGQYSSNLSAQINFNNLTRTLCHGDYVNKNIIFEDNNIWVIDFDKCCYNYAAQDISYFLRRLLKRNTTNWNIEIAKNVLNLYNSINPLTEDDLKYILVYLAFPQKYWRISKDYFNNINKCNKTLFYDLLKKNVEKTTHHFKFIKELELFMRSEFSITLED